MAGNATSYHSVRDLRTWMSMVPLAVMVREVVQFGVKLKRKTCKRCDHGGEHASRE